jgi:hypothetical protein
VSGQFPSAFALNVMTPPPDDVLIGCTDDLGKSSPGRFAFGYIDAILHSADGSNIQLSDLYGYAAEFRLVYVDQDVTECVVTEFKLPALSQGYHLLKRTEGPCQGWADGSCVIFSEVPLATGIELFVYDHPERYGPSIDNPSGGLNSGRTCLSDPLPGDASMASSCRFFVMQRYFPSASLDCSGPGLAPASALDIADVFFDSPQLGNVCEVTQILPSAWTNGSCDQSTQPGWCYVSAAADASCASGAVALSPGTAWAANLTGQFICP